MNRLLILICIVVVIPGTLQAADGPIDYLRDVQPILRTHCTACHGPDQQNAGLRLDTAIAAIAGGDRGLAIIPGDASKSLLIAALNGAGDAPRMPPEDEAEKLPKDQITIIGRWIDQGALHPADEVPLVATRKTKKLDHWAFQSVARPEVPSVQGSKFRIENPVDAFVADRLEREGLSMSSEADRATLIRRVSLDLTGLPPSLEEVDAFLADTRPDAYERAVDRLLGSPHYGEKMAQDWLDLARFGDTNGYQDDAERPSYPYRDAVIDAFNRNQPFDQFTIEQLAGDLLPNPTLVARIASGFNRHHRQNEESGSDPDEFRVVYAVDRTNTVATTWMGLTLGCAQCHDHKYDPLTQREYYQFYAFFNSLQGEVPISTKNPQSIPPQIRVPSLDDQQRLEQLAARRRKLEARHADRVVTAEPAFTNWLAGGRVAPAGIVGGIVARCDVRSLFADTQLGGVLSLENTINGSGRLLVASSVNNSVLIGHLKSSGSNYTNVLGILVAEGPRLFASLGLQDGTHVLSEPLQLEHRVEYEWSYMWQPTGGNDDPADDDQIGEGLLVVEVRRGGQLVQTLNVDATAAHRTRGTVFDAFGLLNDTPGRGEPVELYIDDVHYTAVADQLRQQSFDRDPGWEGLNNHERGQQYGYRSDVALVDFKKDDPIRELLACPSDQLTDLQRQRLREFYLDSYDEDIKQIVSEIAAIDADRKRVEDASPQTLVFEEMESRRPAFVLERGDFQRPKEQVQPDVPAIFPPLPTDVPHNRLTLARWLVDPKHPLTARVAANRLWKQFFGVGLVKTAADFGTQGELPSHPQLLDWLAAQLIDDGWNLKKFQKRLVMSATYRQTSRASRAAYMADPENRILARGSRFRLSAEEIRDSALAVSGLLVRTIGGPSVFPYQPAGFFGDKSSDWSWPDKSDDSIYRRGLYTFWRRTTLYPSLQTLDAPPRNECTVSRPRTNTPLQALITLNDPVFVEAARVFGQRIMQQGGNSPTDRATYAFRTALIRRPKPAELASVVRLFTDRYERYRTDPSAAQQLVAVGKAARPNKLEPTELAAWCSVAATLLNLDEFITRE
jgi:hypothetical protein